MVEALELVELDQDDETHPLSGIRLDHILVRGWDAVGTERCQTRYVDSDSGETMFDHALVSCREPAQ